MFVLCYLPQMKLHVFHVKGAENTEYISLYFYYIKKGQKIQIALKLKIW